MNSPAASKGGTLWELGSQSRSETGVWAKPPETEQLMLCDKRLMAQC